MNWLNDCTLTSCVFEPWPTWNRFLFAKTLFGMNVKGQKTLAVWEISDKGWEGILKQLLN